MKVSAESAGLLRYLRELGWEEVYRQPPTSSLGLGGAAPAAAREPLASEDGRASRAAAPAAPAPGPAPVPESDAASRHAVLAEVAAQASACTACKLSRTRKNVVFGSGSADADLMFIGEGPGAQEDLQGLPFVGAAGELLTRIIRAIDLDRAEVYIANIVKCRPPNNRDPEADEVLACRAYLERQIDLVRPRVIVALGRVAAQTLLETDRPIGKLRGQWFLVRGVETRATYHPAALLRNSALKRPVWEDMQVVRDRLVELAGTRS